MKVTKENLHAMLDLHKDLAYEWNSGEAIKRVRDFATDEAGDIDFTTYAKAFFWVNPDASDKQTSYKLPYADVVDGELKAVWNGVSAAMKALLGNRGDTDVAEEAKEAVYASIAKYYQQFEQEVPSLSPKGGGSDEDDEEDDKSPKEGEDEDEEENKELKELAQATDTDDGTEPEKQFVKALYDHTKGLAVASTDVEDRHGETIDQTGWDLKSFKNNPVMLWSHDHYEIAVGNCRNTRIDKSGDTPKLVFEPDFHTATEKARALKVLYEEGRLNSFSVGFIPKEMDGDRYLKQELLEISAVNVPANPDAMMLAYKSLKDNGIKQETIEELGIPTKLLDKVTTMEKDMSELKSKVDKLLEDTQAQAKVQDNTDTSTAPQIHATKANRSRLSLAKVVAKASDQILEGEKRGSSKQERVQMQKVIKRATEILIRSYK